MQIILAKQMDRDEDIIDVSEHQSLLFGIAIFLFDKGHWVISPVAARVQMVRGVITIVERKAVTLGLTLLCCQ